MAASHPRAAGAIKFEKRGKGYAALLREQASEVAADYPLVALRLRRLADELVEKGRIR